MNPVPVEPIGRVLVTGFRHYRDGHVEHTWIEDEFPPSSRGEALRNLRIELGLSLRQVATALEIAVAQVSSLERGRQTFATDDEWKSAEEKIRSLVP